MQARLIEYKWRRFFFFIASIEDASILRRSNYTSIWSRWKFSFFIVKREKKEKKKNEKETLIRLDNRDIKIVVWRCLLPTRVSSIKNDFAWFFSIPRAILR